MLAPRLLPTALFATAITLASCLPAIATAPKRELPTVASKSAPAAEPVRWFHGLPENAFWVDHTTDRDRVIDGGARLELSPTGELLAPAWELAQSRGDWITGGVAVPARLGGGFVFWSRSRVFWASSFTGKLEPVAMGSAGDAGVRGVRVGLSGMIVITEAGPRELALAKRALAPMPMPAIYDVAALDATRAIRIDVLGRASWTEDGGKRWIDLSPKIGTAVRALYVTPADLQIESWQGRFSVGAGAELSTVEISGRSYYDQARLFQMVWKGTRASERDEWPQGWRDATALQAAIASGASVGDGTAFGVIQQVTVRVEIATGKLVTLATDWIPNGLLCQPLRADDGVLFACTWERYQGAGGYVMRSVGGASPEVERAFTDEGSFVSGEDGALAYVGSCHVEPKVFDPEENSYREEPNDPTVKPVVCVRKAPGVWVERSITVEEGAKLVAWVPRRDGTAVALTLSSAPLPDAASTPLAPNPKLVERGDVTRVRLSPHVPGWSWTLPPYRRYGRSAATMVDRRFEVREDGTIAAWLSPAYDNYSSTTVGATIDREGRVVVHDEPPNMSMMVHNGSFGLSLAQDGHLFETTDHGRSWQDVGLSPMPFSHYGSGNNSIGCSALGCSVGPAVRVGFGRETIKPILQDDTMTPPPNHQRALPRLVCSPKGPPEPLRTPSAPPPPQPDKFGSRRHDPGSSQMVSTPWGDVIEILREVTAHEPPPPPSPFGVPTPPLPSASASAGKPKAPPRASPAVLKTHTITFRPPFEPAAPLRKLDATDVGFQRGSVATPLLAEGGEVHLIVSSDSSEFYISQSGVTSYKPTETRRYYYRSSETASPTGVGLKGGRALLLSEFRRRLTIEDHGPGAPLPPMYFGVERDQHRRRPIVLARRDGGELGLLVLDGAAPETASVAVLDRMGRAITAIEPLAPFREVRTSDDPRCATPEPGSFEVLLALDPNAWFQLDPRGVPEGTLGRQGMVIVRWGRERACLSAIDLSLNDARRRSEGTRSWSLVARWGAKGRKGAGAAIRARDLRRDVECTLKPPEGP